VAGRASTVVWYTLRRRRAHPALEWVRLHPHKQFEEVKQTLTKPAAAIRVRW